MKPNRKHKSFLRRHSLSITALAMVILWIALYRHSDPKTHLGSFFGNAVADWTGVFVTIVMTKFLYEKGSSESRQPRRIMPPLVMEVLREHSLTIFLVLTGVGWVIAFQAMDPISKWGQVVGNIVSEWTQILGLVLMTKKLMEVGSKL